MQSPEVEVPVSIETLRATHANVYHDVLVERLRQLNKFGPQDRPPFEWFLILSEEVGEVAKECVEIQFNDAAHPKANPEAYRKELVEVAAVALAALQNFDQRAGIVRNTPESGAAKRFAALAQLFTVLANDLSAALDSEDCKAGTLKVWNYLTDAMLRLGMITK